MNEPVIDKPPRRQNPWPARVGLLLLACAAAYLLVAYVAAPLWWERYARRHPAIDETPGVTETGDKHPGDPINIALVGMKEDVQRCMQEAGWFPADPLGIRSDLKIAADTVLKRPYDDAPVSKLFLDGRVEDLAFEQPVGNDPRQRHHVRFWKSSQLDDQGRPLWAGSATYDKRVGLSHTTGQITHHISGEVDAERDHLLENLKTAGVEASVQWIDGFHKTLEGINGGGDRWHTDGRLPVVELTP
jgi:hypothetical protein